MTATIEGAPGTTVAEAKPAPSPSELMDLRAESPIGLMRLALEKGAGIEQLSQLVELHERMATRQARQEFYAALARVRQKCPPLQHTRKANIATKGGGSYSFTYTELPEMQKALDPFLVAEGFSYTWDTEVSAAGMLTCVFHLRHALGHAESSRMTLPTENNSGMSPQQKVGAAMSFAQRRTMAAGLGVTTEEAGEPVEESDPTPISAAQIARLEDILAGKMVDVERFLRYMDVAAVKDIRTSDFKKAETALLSAKNRSKE